MPFIEVKLWKGRSGQQKKEIIKNITDATVKSIQCPQEAVHVVLQEYDKENWGMGGEVASEKFPD